MKKFYLFVATLFAAITINAKEIVIDLSTAVEEVTIAADGATFSLEEGVLTVNWTATGGWEEQGVAFPLNNLEEITSISYEYKGDGVADYQPDGVCLYPRLRDTEGKRWYKSSYWPNVSSTTWKSETILPDACPHDGATYAFGEHPFANLAFVVDPSKAGTGTFYIRNVVITVPDDATAFSNVQAEQKAQKVVRNGQIFIIRDGRTFNALGTEVK